MKRLVRAVVFDLDGTLIDSRQDIVLAANFALAAHGFRTREKRTLASFVGDGARPLLARAAGIRCDDPRIDALVESFVVRYSARATEHTFVMPGALEALDDLAALPLAICTNKPRATARVVLEELDLLSRFEVVVAGGDLPTKKPSPEPIVFIAERLGLNPSDLVVVGDGPQDVNAGRAAGARTAGVEGGIIERSRLVAAAPDVMLRSLVELRPFIEDLERGVHSGNE